MPKRKAQPDFSQPQVKRVAKATNVVACKSIADDDCAAISLSRPASPTRLLRTLPPHLHICLKAQKRAILRSLRNPKIYGEEEPSLDTDDDKIPANSVAYTQLTELIQRSIDRGETNSCLLVGPRNSGKTKLVDRCIANCKDRPVIIRLSGLAQSDDRQAIKEIGWQLTQQTGQDFNVPDDATAADRQQEDDELGHNIESPFISASLPPAHRISELISCLPELSRPSIIVIEAIDLFTLHTRQALLYCLFDMVQTSRPGSGCRGVTVIGVTSRIDAINLFEKRVKSRFSGRILRTAPLRKHRCTSIIKRILCKDGNAKDSNDEWNSFWLASVDHFLDQQEVQDKLEAIFSLTGDLHLLGRILTRVVMDLSPSSPHLSISSLDISMHIQSSRPDYPFLQSLSYPAICVLIAFMHMRTSGHDTANFETLYNAFNDQVNFSSSAPVQMNGMSVGMLRCGRGVLMNAFDGLICMRIIVPAGTAHVSREFLKYTCVVDRPVIKRAVEAIGNTNLKKWLERAS